MSNQKRTLTPREAARLQGFPEDFIIPVSDVQAYKQFGNSVCVPVIKALSQQIYLYLEKKIIPTEFNLFNYQNYENRKLNNT